VCAAHTQHVSTCLNNSVHFKDFSGVLKGLIIDVNLMKCL